MIYKPKTLARLAVDEGSPLTFWPDEYRRYVAAQKAEITAIMGILLADHVRKLEKEKAYLEQAKGIRIKHARIPRQIRVTI